MKISENIKENIAKYLGDKTEDYLKDIANKIEKYTQQWKLSQLVFTETETMGLIFFCDSVIYGVCILKFCIPEPEFETGLNCLLSYNGNSYVKIHAYDKTDYVLLMERVIPGDTMWEVENFRERARLFAELVKDLPILWDGSGKFPTYRMWMEELRTTLISLGDRDDALFYLDKALLIYDELKQKYNRKCLLHGDMHQENMLLNTKSSYTIIDPKGVVDDPVMETARFLMNESPCDIGEIEIKEIISIISSIIGIPEADVTKSMFIDAALAQCWGLDKPFSDKHDFSKEKQKVLNICAFTYGLL